MEAVRPEWSEQELPLPEAGQFEAARPPEHETEEAQALAIAEGELATKALEKQPVVASDIVSKAAEKDRPIEKELEERHERRGSLDDQQVASVATILAKSKLPSRQQEPKEESVETAQQVTTPISLPVADDDDGSAQYSQPTLYGQAIRTGFIGAVVIIFVFSLLLILT